MHHIRIIEYFRNQGCSIIEVIFIGLLVLFLSAFFAFLVYVISQL